MWIKFLFFPDFFEELKPFILFIHIGSMNYFNFLQSTFNFQLVNGRNVSNFQASRPTNSGSENVNQLINGPHFILFVEKWSIFGPLLSIFIKSSSLLSQREIFRWSLNSKILRWKPIWDRFQNSIVFRFQFNAEKGSFVKSFVWGSKFVENFGPISVSSATYIMKLMLEVRSN